MKHKFYLLFVYLVYAVTVNSQIVVNMVKSPTCKLQLDCKDNTSPELVFTKANIKKGSEKQHSYVKMASINKIRKTASLNKKKIAKNERSIKALEDISKITVKNISTLLRQEVLLSEELSKKIQDFSG